jgi:hypothetical protein
MQVGSLDCVKKASGKSLVPTGERLHPPWIRISSKEQIGAVATAARKHNVCLVPEFELSNFTVAFRLYLVIIVQPLTN